MYILNKCPTKRLQGYTPEEAWSEKKPSVSHFRIFGSLCFRHVPEQNRKKLDDKAEPMILIGYHPTSAYKLYDPRMRKVVISRYVLINETKGCVATYPSAGRRCGARRCVFQERKMHGVATNVYSRKMSEKTGKDVVYEL